MDFSQQSSKEDYGLNIDERNKKRSEFTSSFNSRFHNNSNSENSGGSRKAGEYLSQFAKQPGVSEVLTGAKDYRNGATNDSAVMKTVGQGSTPPQAQPAKASATPAKKVSAQPVATPAGGIDYGAMADARMATATKGEIKGGVNKEYLVNMYKKNNSEYEQNKALMANYQGPKSWDEFTEIDQNRSGTGAQKNTDTIADYGKFTKYMTAQQGVKQWEDASPKYRT